jgi:hypothetical protein
MSPTQRSLKLLRSRGYTCEIVERWNPFAHIRQDLFGFIDIVAINGNETLAVQTTTAGNAAARVAKIRGLQLHSLWLESPHRKIVVHGWAKRGPRGKRKVWECGETEINNL